MTRRRVAPETTVGSDQGSKMSVCKRTSLVTIGLLAVASVAAACSSSSSGSPQTQTTNTPSDASADLVGDGPVGQLNPPTMTPMTTTPQPVQCGSTTCNPPSGSAVPLSACCLPDNSCGGTFGGAALGMFGGGGDAGAPCLSTSPGTPDTSCPSQSAMGFALAGCCTAAGVCGIDLSMAGLGCNSASALAALAPPGTVPASDGGAPQACSGNAGAADSGTTTPADGG
jgi:hypothetical protein